MRPGFSFAIEARDGNARCALLTTPHGAIETPAFMAVGTYGAVRGLDFGELRALGAQVLLSNTYHLHERPGEDLIRDLGGLHGFSGWHGPWLTDSGGFQVTSLADRCTIDETGVRFRSPLDGRVRELSPERAIAIQNALGSDIAMVLDECQPPSAGAARNRDALARTQRWAERCRAAHRRSDQALFGIVQGGDDLALRRSAARACADLGFDGHAHGGLGLGEGRAQRCELIAAAQEALPPELPRYAMGIGRPLDLLDAVAAGVDLFDCVLPTRNGRHGLAFGAEGALHLRNAAFRNDPAPIDADCDCPACRGHSRAYLHHLLRSREALGSRLVSLHNLRFYYALLAAARHAIRQGRFAAFRAGIEERSAEGNAATRSAGPAGLKT